MSSIILFVSFVGMLLIGLPIAFGMLLSAALALYVDDTIPMAMLGQRMGTGVENFTYLAIPLFILAGSIMEHSGISRRLVTFARALVGHLPGGMGHVVIVSEIFFSGISGASLSDASAIGSLMFPALKRSGYDSGRATALIAAACAMGILIPPCLTMVVLGALAGVSVSALFFAGFLPGFVMAVALMAFVYYQAKRGILPGGEARASWSETGRAALDSLIPLMMPVIIFGGIFGGVFSATEAAAVAVLYAAIVGILVYREINFATIYKIFVDTAVITGAIGLILGAAAGFATLIALNGLPAMVSDLILSISKNPIVFMVAVNLVFVLFGAVLDGIPALLLFVPIFLPVATSLGIDPLHFSLVSVASLGIGVIVPPIGIMLLVICSITGTSLSDASRKLMPYLVILGVCLFIIIAIPWVVLVVPRAMGL